MLEAVLPLSNRLKPRRNLERFEMLLRSFVLFWRGDAPLRLHVVVPDSEYRETSIWLIRHQIYPNVKLHLMTESDISPVLGAVEPGLGIMKQMLIKLAAFDIVKADNVLLLDSDIVACRPFSERELISGGRNLTEWVKPKLEEWWRESARVLGYEFPPGTLAQNRMFVTPQILSRHIVTPLHQYLEKKYDASWMMALIAEYSNKHPDIWTEYTLYDLFAERGGLRARYHLGPDEMPGGTLHCMKQSIWGAESFEGWEPERALEGLDTGFFLVLQSITAAKLDFDLVRNRWRAAVRARFPGFQ